MSHLAGLVFILQSAHRTQTPLTQAALAVMLCNVFTSQTNSFTTSTAEPQQVTAVTDRGTAGLPSNERRDN